MSRRFARGLLASTLRSGRPRDRRTGWLLGEFAWFGRRWNVIPITADEFDCRDTREVRSHFARRDRTGSCRVAAPPASSLTADPLIIRQAT